MNYDRNDARDLRRRPPRLARGHDRALDGGSANHGGGAGQLAVASESSADATGGRAAARVDAQTRRCNVVRDGCAAVLLLAAVALPWNLYFGIGVPGSSGAVSAVVITSVVLSLGSLVATYAGHDRLRLLFSTPAVLVVAAFVVFAVVQMVRYGGTAVASPGVGPGAWSGVAGALLAAQPIFTGAAADAERFAAWLRAARVVGLASMILGALSVGFTLYWRTRHAWPPAGDSTHNGENVAVIATAVVYGVAALAPIIVGCIWMRQRTAAARLATITVGVCSLAGGILIWVSQIGREIDAFHGIAQLTSTSGVGFEGYVAWAAGAAILAPLTLYSVLVDDTRTAAAWKHAASKALLLVAIWCAASAAMRFTDVVDALALHLQHRFYDSAGLIGVDLATGAVAVWLGTRFGAVATPSRSVQAGCAMLLALSVTRVVAGVMLAPRKTGAAAAVARDNPVYGNALAQQITSTFDVVVCGLAVMILMVAVLSGWRRAHRGRDATDAGAVSTVVRDHGAVAAPDGSIAARPGSVPSAGTAGAKSSRPPSDSVRAPRLFRDPSTRRPPLSATHAEPHQPVTDAAVVPAASAEIASHRSPSAAEWARLLRPAGDDARAAAVGDLAADGPEWPGSAGAPSGRVAEGSGRRLPKAMNPGEPGSDKTPELGEPEVKLSAAQPLSPDSEPERIAADPVPADESNDRPAAAAHAEPTGIPAASAGVTDRATPERPVLDSSQRFPAGMTYSGPWPPKASQIRPESKTTTSEGISGDQFGDQNVPEPPNPDDSDRDAAAGNDASVTPADAPDEPRKILRDSTQRFPAGITYGGPGAGRGPHPPPH